MMKSRRVDLERGEKFGFWGLTFPLSPLSARSERRHYTQAQQADGALRSSSRSFAYTVRTMDSVISLIIQCCGGGSLLRGGEF